MKKFGSALVGILDVTFTATSASAAIVCNEIGDCWHVKDKYEYKPEFNVHVYGDDWNEHEGRGYWNPKGVWIGF